MHGYYAAFNPSEQPVQFDPGAHMELLVGESRKLAEQLLRNFPALLTKLYLTVFTAADATFYEVTLYDRSPTGLVLYTHQHDAVFPSNLVFAHGLMSRDYIDAGVYRKDLVNDLFQIYLEDWLGYCTFHGERTIDSGTLKPHQIDRPRSWESNGMEIPEWFRRAWPFGEKRNLRHVIRSWNRTYDQEFTSIG